MNVGDSIHSIEVDRKVISDMIEVVVDVLTYELILAAVAQTVSGYLHPLTRDLYMSRGRTLYFHIPIWWADRVKCPGSYIRSLGDRASFRRVRPVGVISFVLGI